MAQAVIDLVLTAEDYFDRLTLLMAKVIVKSGGEINPEAQAALIEFSMALREALCLPNPARH